MLRTGNAFITLQQVFTDTTQFELFFRQMDIKSRTLVTQLDMTIVLYDKLFRQISPVEKYNEKCNDDRSILPRNLTDQQCSAINDLSGILKELKNCCEPLRNRSDSFKELNSVKPRWEKEVVDKEATLTKALKTIAILREYLTLELCKSEELEHQLKEKESALVTTTAAHDKLLKKSCRSSKPLLSPAMVKNESDVSEANLNTKAVVSSQNVYLSSSNHEKSSFVVDPLELVGQYIRKQFDQGAFFGFVSTYDAHVDQYMIVYEDADYEDMDKKELLSLLWRHDVPAAKKTACERHRKHLIRKKKIPARNKLLLKKENTEGNTGNDYSANVDTNNKSVVNSADTFITGGDIGTDGVGSTGSANTAGVCVCDTAFVTATAGEVLGNSHDVPNIGTFDTGAVHTTIVVGNDQQPKKRRRGDGAEVRALFGDDCILFDTDTNNPHPHTVDFPIIIAGDMTG